MLSWTPIGLPRKIANGCILMLESVRILSYPSGHDTKASRGSIKEKSALPINNGGLKKPLKSNTKEEKNLITYSKPKSPQTRNEKSI